MKRTQQQNSGRENKGGDNLIPRGNIYELLAKRGGEDELVPNEKQQTPRAE